MVSNHTTTRRQLLIGATGSSVFGLSGCLAGDGNGNSDENSSGDESNSYTARTATAGGGTWDVGLAFERAVAEHSDSINYSTIESSGNIANVYSMDEDQFDTAFIDTVAMTKAQNNQAEFNDEPVETIPWQGFRTFIYGYYWVARSDTDIETFDDLAGANVYPAEPGYSSRSLALDILQMPQVEDVYEEMNIMDMNVDDAPGAMEEGRIDVSLASGTPGVGHTGYVVEYGSRVDVNYVEPTDEFIEAAEEYEAAPTATFDVEELMWDQDIGTDEVFTWTLPTTFTFHHDTPEEVGYELARIAHEHDDTVRDAEPRFDTMDEAEDLTRAAIDDYPFHPGVAEYLMEHDAWDDENWIVGEEPGTYTNE